jgi:chromate transporter
MIAFQLFLVFAGLSLLAVGGINALVPEMYRVLVEERGWLDAQKFAQLYALGQAAPGPNVIAASLFGHWIGGLPGFVAATLGIVLPSATLAWIVAGLAQRLAAHPLMAALRAGLVPVALGLMAAAGLIMAGAVQAGWVGLLVVAAATLFVWKSRFTPLWVLAAGGVLGGLLGL